MKDEDTLLLRLAMWIERFAANIPSPDHPGYLEGVIRRRPACCERAGGRAVVSAAARRRAAPGYAGGVSHIQAGEGHIVSTDKKPKRPGDLKQPEHCPIPTARMFGGKWTERGGTRCTPEPA